MRQRRVVAWLVNACIIVTSSRIPQQQEGQLYTVMREKEMREEALKRKERKRIRLEKKGGKRK